MEMWITLFQNNNVIVLEVKVEVQWWDNAVTFLLRRMSVQRMHNNKTDVCMNLIVIIVCWVLRKTSWGSQKTNVSAKNSICDVGLCVLHIWNMKFEELNKVTYLLWQNCKSLCTYVCWCHVLYILGVNFVS